MHSVNKWSSECRGNSDRWKDKSQIDQKAMLQCRLQSSDEETLPEDRGMILQCELWAGNNVWSKKVILQGRLRSGNDVWSREVIWQWWLRSGNDGWSKGMIWRWWLRSGNVNMIERDLVVQIKRSKYKVKLVVRLKAIEYKKASPVSYLPTPSAKPFPSSMP